MSSLFQKSLLLLFPVLSLSTSLYAATAKVNAFTLIHPESTIIKDSSYAALNKLSDSELKQSVFSPKGTPPDYVTVKKGTMSLRDGNTRIYLLRKRGFGDLVIPYDEVDASSYHYDFY